MIKIIFDRENKMAVAYDNDIQVGECVFIESSGAWNIIHTGVNEDYQGKGIAKRLVDCVIANAKECGKKTTASCSYAKMVLNRYERESKK